MGNREVDAFEIVPGILGKFADLCGIDPELPIGTPHAQGFKSGILHLGGTAVRHGIPDDQIIEFSVVCHGTAKEKRRKVLRRCEKLFLFLLFQGNDHLPHSAFAFGLGDDFGIFLESQVDDTAVMSVHFRELDGVAPTLDLFCGIQSLPFELFFGGKTLTAFFSFGAFPSAESLGGAVAFVPPVL